MEKKLIHSNNTIKFKKNKEKDLLLRKFDKKISYLNKKITRLSYDFFVANRQIYHLNRINNQLISYMKKEQRNDYIFSHIIKELKLINQEIYRKSLDTKTNLNSYQMSKKKMLIRLYQSFNIT